jgi:hypothetical protein
MQYNSVEDVITHLETQVYNLTKTCDNQAKKIENLEDSLYHLLGLLNKSENSDKSQEIDELIKIYVHNCNLYSKKV